MSKIIIPSEEQEEQEIQDKKFFDKYLDHSWVNQAWLGLGNTSHIKLDNPILHRTKEDIENPGLHLLRTMRKPSYLAFAAGKQDDIFSCNNWLNIISGLLSLRCHCVVIALSYNTTAKIRIIGVCLAQTRPVQSVS